MEETTKAERALLISGKLLASSERRRSYSLNWLRLLVQWSLIWCVHLCPVLPMMELVPKNSNGPFITVVCFEPPAQITGRFPILWWNPQQQFSFACAKPSVSINVVRYLLRTDQPVFAHCCVCGEENLGRPGARAAARLTSTRTGMESPGTDCP